MSLENLALFETHTLPIKHSGDVHSGKVRSVYWLNPNDSATIINRENYQVPLNSQLGIMVISDRISAFDVIWQAEEGLCGVPGKGASLNAITQYWFNQFDAEGLAGNHVLDVPHPLVWIVKRAGPILVEGVARQYITGSMWRAYERGERVFCGNALPNELEENQKLPELLITPTTKGDLGNATGLPKGDDADLSRQIILANFKQLGFRTSNDVDLYEELLRQGFNLIARDLASIGQLFVDTKFEFGYIRQGEGMKMIYIDEIGTPDSSRIWDAGEYVRGRVVENSKEPYRQFLLANTDRDVLLNKKRMPERRELAASYRVPVSVFMQVSQIYTGIAEKITGVPVPEISDARAEILDALNSYKLVA